MLQTHFPFGKPGHGAPNKGPDPNKFEARRTNQVKALQEEVSIVYYRIIIYLIEDSVELYTAQIIISLLTAKTKTHGSTKQKDHCSIEFWILTQNLHNEILNQIIIIQ